MGGRLAPIKTMSQPRRKQPIYSDGFVKPGFEKVLEVFRYNLENDIERGGTFAAYYRGELVVNIWGGYADRKAHVKWKRDMMPCFYSTTKSPSAAVIAHLVDRGFLDYSEKVCKYWPDFAANGKDDITLETLVTNRAGLSCTEEKFTVALSKDDPEKLGKILANQKPLWKPGTNHGYHPITFALYLDQIVRRADPLKRSLAQYFHEEMAVPFGLDFKIGLPYEEQYKAPHIVMMKAFDQQEYIQNFKGDLSILQLTATNPTDFIGVRRMNDPDIRVLPVGSICGHGTAESMAKFHAILGEGGSWRGRQLLSKASVDRFQQMKSAGFDLAFGMDGMWSYGMMLFPVKEQGKPVLEEVCKKQGFLPPEDFTLKHGRKPVDVTLSLRYSNLPNNVKLELVKSESSRAEQDVLIALQLEDGQRLQHTFPPATSLWDILQHWENADSTHKGNLCKVDPSTKPPTQTTCIYMREEIIGEIALQSMTLRKLGLTGGKAVIRLVHRPVDDSIMAEILDKIEREKTKLQKLDLMAQRQLSQQEEKSEDPVQSKEAQSEDKSSTAEDKTEEPKNSASRTSESMEVDAKQSASVPSTSQQQQPMEVEDKIETEGHRAMATGQGRGQSNQQQDFAETIRQMNIPGVQVFSPGDFHELSAQEQEVARRLAAHYMPLMGLQPSPDQQTAAAGSKPKRGRPQEAPMFSEFKFPEETKGKEVYKNELSEVNREEYKPCDRQAVLFNAEETTRTTASNEDLPDEFFEINENDIRKMMVDLQKKVEADQPLLTRSMIQERLESKYAKYQQVVVRVQFPDKVVLQGLFRPKETVHALHKFVRGHLEDKSLKFYLYTAPPKQVLKDQTLTLIQAKLAPASVVYFGSETTKDHYLSEAVMKEIGPKSKAEDIVENCLPKDDTSTSTGMVSNPGPSKPKPSKPASNASGDPKKPGVPKWFTVGKK